MSRTLSKLFVKINLILYAVNFAVLFVVMMLLLSATKNLAFYLIPGIFFCALICLVYPDFFNVIAGLFGWQEVTNPTPTQAFDHIKQIIQDATNRDYSFLKDNGIVVATFCAVICWIVGIVCMFQQARLNKIVNSPMDWYKRKFLSTYIYAGFGGIYGVTMCVGACAILFAKQKLTGGLMTLAVFFLICGIAIVAGVVLLILERFLSTQIFNSLTVAEQVAVCEKQAKYMNKRQRKRQVRRLGDKARTTAQLENKNQAKAKNNKTKGKQGKRADATVIAPITTIEPTDMVAPTNQIAQATEQPTYQPVHQPDEQLVEQLLTLPTEQQIEIVTDDIFIPSDNKPQTDEIPPSDDLPPTDN